MRRRGRQSKGTADRGAGRSTDADSARIRRGVRDRGRSDGRPLGTRCRETRFAPIPVGESRSRDFHASQPSSGREFHRRASRRRDGRRIEYRADDCPRVRGARCRRRRRRSRRGRLALEDEASFVIDEALGVDGSYLSQQHPPPRIRPFESPPAPREYPERRASKAQRPRPARRPASFDGRRALVDDERDSPSVGSLGATVLSTDAERTST